MEVQFTDRELDVMSVLWEAGSATVSEVQAALPDRLAYTTVLTVLRVLESKGFVDHTTEGRAHRYLPLVEQTDASTSALKRVTSRLFGGSPELLLTRLVDTHDLAPDDLERMRALIDERLAQEDE